MKIDRINDTSTIDTAAAYIIQRTGRLLRYHLNKIMRENGANISVEQWTILFRLWEKDGRSQTELADKDLNDHPNITRLVDALEKAELVRRDPDPSDRRRRLVCLSPQGRAFMEKMIPTTPAMRRQVFAGISAEEVEQLVATLKKVEANITRSKN